MKKVIAVFLSVIMIAFCFSSCGKPSKESLLKGAEEIKLNAMAEAVKSNINKAKEDMQGKAYIFTECIDEITEGGIRFTDTNYSIDVSLSKEELTKLEAHQQVQIVGIVDSVDTFDKPVNIPGGISSNYQAATIIIKEAALVADEFEITGELKFDYMDIADLSGNTMERVGWEEAWYMYIEMPYKEYHLEKAIPVEHHVGENILKINYEGYEIHKYDNITVKGKIFYRDRISGRTQYNMRNIQIVNLEKSE